MTAKKNSILNEIPYLEGWLTGPQIAQALGLTRQSVHKMMLDGTFQTIHAVGDKPVYVVALKEVQTIAQQRADTSK